MVPIELELLLDDITLSNLTLDSQISRDHNGKVSFILKNLGIIRKELLKVEKTSLYDKEIEQLKTGSIFINYPETLTADEKMFTLLADELSTIRLGIKGIKRYFSQKSQNDYSDEVLNIRLPKTDDFDSLAKSIEELKKIITIPLLTPGIDATTKIVKGDEGSVVIVVVVAAATLEIARKAYRLIAEIQWSSYVIAKKRTEAKMAQSVVQSMELDLEVKKAVSDAKEQLIKTFITHEAKSIIERFGIENDQENIKRLELAIITLDKFHEKGGELMPGLFIPEDVRNLFPPKEKTNMIESRIGKLSEGKTN